MSVQSARVQEIVKGDDVVMTHQIMKDVAFNAEASRAPVTLNEGDTVNFFYPLESQCIKDLVGYPGTAVGEFPASIFTVPIAGTIVETPPAPNRGTVQFQSGLGRTVRAEITREAGTKETYYLIDEVDVFERGFPTSLTDTSGGLNPPAPPLNLT